MSYPEFRGGPSEDVEEFLERMEVACISNHIEDEAQLLRLLQICLKGDARVWCKAYEEELKQSDPPIPLELDNLKAALLDAFVKVEDPDKIWQAMQGLVQNGSESVESYNKKFVLLWKSLCRALPAGQVPPDMMMKEKFLAGLKESLRWKVELKKPKTYEDALEIAQEKEWKFMRMAQLGMSIVPITAEKVQQVDPTTVKFPVEVLQQQATPCIVAPQVVPTVAVATTTTDEGLKQEMRSMVDMMKNLSLNLLSNVGNGRGHGGSYSQSHGNGEDQRRGGGGRGYGRGSWRNVPTCYNCGELGHISSQCDKPPRMGGDMYPLPTTLPNRSNDFGIEIKGDDAGPSRLTTEDKGKAKVVSVVALEKTEKEDADVMPLGKRTTEEKEGRDAAGPSKKKGKAHEGEDAKVKRKRRARRKFTVTDFPLGEGQTSYNLKDDISGRKADVTFGQLVEMVPRMKRQWKRLVSPLEKEPKKGSVRVLSIEELTDICPTVDVWHRKKSLGQGYIDGGAQICVITHSCVERLGLDVSGISGFRIRMANHQKVKCLGIVKELEIDAYDVKAIVDFHVMPAGMGAYPIILGRPWLRAVGAVQDWRNGTICLHGKMGHRKLCDMHTQKVIREVHEDDADSSEEDFSNSDSSYDTDSGSSSLSEEEVNVAFLYGDQEYTKDGMADLKEHGSVLTENLINGACGNLQMAEDDRSSVAQENHCKQHNESRDDSVSFVQQCIDEYVDDDINWGFEELISEEEDEECRENVMKALDRLHALKSSENAEGSGELDEENIFMPELQWEIASAEICEEESFGSVVLPSGLDASNDTSLYAEVDGWLADVPPPDLEFYVLEEVIVEVQVVEGQPLGVAMLEDVQGMPFDSGGENEPDGEEVRKVFDPGGSIVDKCI